MYDMTIQLKENSEKCLYEQIYDYIRLEIREGKLLAGEKLPSTRSLADYLQVARSTVDYAYDQLLSEGYIEAKPYRGYYVCRIEDLQKEIVIPRETIPVEDSEQGEWICDFSPNGVDMSGFPFGVWKRITKNILNDSNNELFAQGEAQGDLNLRITISRYLHSARGVNCRPEQIIVGAGNDYLLMLLEKILGRHVPIAMDNPTYKRAYKIFKSFAYPITTVNMDEGGMQVDALQKEGIRIAYIMPSHQFPTGAVMPIGRRTELLKWASEKEDRYLIEDDYDSEFRYRGKPIPSLQASDEQGKVIYMGTFSKAIAPAIRVSYMVLPQSLLEIYRRDCSFYSCTVSRIDQRILDEFIRDGYFERHLNKMRKLYRDKHDLLLECLKPLSKQIQITGEYAGLHILITSLNGLTEREMVARAACVGVRVYGLSESMVEENSDGKAADSSKTVLLGFGGLSQEEIKEGVSLLISAWTK